MQHVIKNNRRPSKGTRLNWVSVKQANSVTVDKLKIKGAKVFSNAPVGKMTTCNVDSTNLLIP